VTLPEPLPRSEALLTAISNVLAEPPSGPATASSPAGPYPFYTWLLVCLMRQLVRQRWLVAVRNERLTDVEGDEGEVPGLPGWSYELHGIGLCLSGPGNEVLDVDFHDEGGSIIDPYFFARRVHLLASPPFPEARLRALLPTAELVARAIRQLLTHHLLLVPHERGHVFRLDPALEALADAAAALPEEAWRAGAARLGDYEEGHAQAESVRVARRDWLLAILASEDRPWAALGALATLLPQAAFAELCARVLDQRPVGSFSAEVVLALEALPDELGSAAVLRLLPRLSPEEHHPYPAWATCAYLLRRGLARDEAVRTLMAFGRVEQVKGYNGNPYLGELAQLALAYAPQQALELIRRALRRGVPATQALMAAMLAVIGRAWCWRELAAALADTEDRAQGLYLCQALRHSTRPEARAAVERWLRTHPLAEHEGPGFTWEEVMDANSDSWFENALEEARAWVASQAEPLPDLL
jgi:hypothetical protein